MLNRDHTFSVTRLRFDEDYHPADNTRITTNFANLARGENRKTNLRNTLRMIDNRCNALVHWDNENGDRYAVELDIVSVEIDVDGSGNRFPMTEMLRPTIFDRKTNKRIHGVVGNNFSSYVRDYDFSVLLLEHNKDKETFSIPNGFGDLHGQLFKFFVSSETYKEVFDKSPIICLSVSHNQTYRRQPNRHPILGAEYRSEKPSLTEGYFAKMGLQVRYFMPPDSVAPLAFFFSGDLLADYTDLELIATISTMEAFQKIYRPEIYNANSAATGCFRPKLDHEDYSLTRVLYDREERSQLAVVQGKFAQDNFIRPYHTILSEWSRQYAV